MDDGDSRVWEQTARLPNAFEQLGHKRAIAPLICELAEGFEHRACLRLVQALLRQCALDLSDGPKPSDVSDGANGEG